MSDGTADTSFWHLKVTLSFGIYFLTLIKTANYESLTPNWSQFKSIFSLFLALFLKYIFVQHESIDKESKLNCEWFASIWHADIQKNLLHNSNPRTRVGNHCLCQYYDFLLDSNVNRYGDKILKKIELKMFSKKMK